LLFTLVSVSPTALVAQTTDVDLARTKLLALAQSEVLQQVKQAVASRKAAAAKDNAATGEIEKARRTLKAAETTVKAKQKALGAVDAALSTLVEAVAKEQSAQKAFVDATVYFTAAKAATPPTSPAVLAVLQDGVTKLEKDRDDAVTALQKLIKKIKSDLKITTYADDAKASEVKSVLGIEKRLRAAALAEATKKKDEAQKVVDDAVKASEKAQGKLWMEDHNLQQSLLPLLQFEENQLSRIGNATLVELRDAVSSSDSDEKTAKAIKALMVKVGQTTKAVQGVGQKVDDVGTKVTEVKTEVAGVKTEVAGLRADLKKQSASAIKQIVAALGKIKLPKAPEVKEAAETLERDIKVNVSLPDKQFKAMVAQLKKILVILESKDDVDTLKLIHELLKRQAADAAAATKAKQSSQTSYVDHCGRKVLFPRLRRN
jgi:hypothetical protein